MLGLGSSADLKYLCSTPKSDPLTKASRRNRKSRGAHYQVAFRKNSKISQISPDFSEEQIFPGTGRDFQVLLGLAQDMTIICTYTQAYSIMPIMFTTGKQPMRKCSFNIKLFLEVVHTKVNSKFCGITKVESFDVVLCSQKLTRHVISRIIFLF